MISKKPKKPAPGAAETKFVRNGSAGKARTLRPVLISFDQDLLMRLDLKAAEMGLSRTAFVVNSVAERLMALGAR
jgi:hypothetical protein